MKPNIAPFYSITFLLIRFLVTNYDFVYIVNKMSSRAVQIAYTLMGKNNVNHTTNDPIICFSTTENLDSDPDPKSGSRKKRIFDKLST